MKKEFLEVARKNDISSDVASVFADKLAEEGYVLAKSPKTQSTGESKLNVQPAAVKPAPTSKPDTNQPATKT